MFCCKRQGNFDKCIVVDSVACNSCYLFCKRSLQQADDSLLSIEYSSCTEMSFRIGYNNVATAVSMMRLCY